MTYFLRYQDDYLEEAEPYRTKTEAINAFQATAEELARYDQRIEATIHIADSMDDLQEYPDFVLTLGPRGGVRVTAA